MNTLALLPTCQTAMTDDDPHPPSRERPVAPDAKPESVAAWARDAVDDLLGGAAETVADSVSQLALLLTADVLARGCPPVTIRIIATPDTVDVAVAGARTVAQRTTLSHDTPEMVEARRLAENVLTRVGPGGRGSVVTASVPLVTPSRLRTVLRWVAGHRR